jgi:hypothetical protein
MVWMVEDLEFESSRCKIFLLPMSTRLVLGPIFLSNEYWGLFPQGVKQPGCETDQLPPASAEVKNSRICAATAPYIFMA